MERPPFWFVEQVAAAARDPNEQRGSRGHDGPLRSNVFILRVAKGRSDAHSFPRPPHHSNSLSFTSTPSRCLNSRPFYSHAHSIVCVRPARPSAAWLRCRRGKVNRAPFTAAVTALFRVTNEVFVFAFSAALPVRRSPWLAWLLLLFSCARSSFVHVCGSVNTYVCA